MNINQHAAEVERHLEEALAFNRRLPHLQIAEKAQQLSKRFSRLTDSVKVNIC